MTEPQVQPGIIVIKIGTSEGYSALAASPKDWLLYGSVFSYAGEAYRIKVEKLRP